MANPRTNSGSQETWLQANWRPLVMMFFCVMLGAYWLGFTPATLPVPMVERMFDLMMLSFGGYIGGRSVEKVASIVAPQIPRLTKK